MRINSASMTKPTEEEKTLADETEDGEAYIK